MSAKSLLERPRSGLVDLRGLALVLVLVLGLPATALASPPPSEPRTEPVEVTPTGVKLKGTLNPQGAPTYYSFAYKESDAVECEDEWGCAPTTPRAGPLAGSTSQEASAEVQFAYLRPGKTYVYWLIVESQAGVRLARSATGQFEAPVPGIDSESASQVTSTDATLEATINPGQRVIRYQFQIAENPNELRSELVCPTEAGPPYLCLGEHVQGALPLGFIGTEHEEYAAANGPDARLDLASAGVTLRPDTTYYYRVLGAPEIATVPSAFWWERPAVMGPEQTFTTPPASAAPTIDSVSVSHLLPTDATLEAKIDTEGLPTVYQFRLSSICGGRGACLVVIDYPLPSGLLLGSFVDQSVSLDLNSAGVTLQPGGTYSYSVSATNTAGTTESPVQTMTTPEDGVEPLSTPTSTPSGVDQPAGSNSADQPAGVGDSSSSVMSSATVLDANAGKASEPKSLKSTLKLAMAPRACAKKPKKQRATCEKQSHKKHAASLRRFNRRG